MCIFFCINLLGILLDNHVYQIVNDWNGDEGDADEVDVDT